jgi:modulator of FtsH protease HflC
MNRLVALGVAVVVLLYILFSSIYVVNVREQAIVMRFGKITDVHSEPGLYFKLPTSFVDTVQIIEERLLRYDIQNMTLQVKGGKFYQVDAFLAYRISNPRLFRERALGELRLVEDRINTRFDAALRQVYGKRDFNAALSEERSAMMREARDLIKPDMDELGIDIVDVRILRTDLTQQVSAQTFDRMKAERLAEAAFLRARGQEAAQTLKAIADRQAVVIVAAANRDSEILRGEGDATRNAVFASAYGQDQEFFSFYRSLQSYRTALGATGTTMVLAPDSEFFKYFSENSVGGIVPAPTAPDGIAPLATSVPTVSEPANVLPSSDQSEEPSAQPTVSLDDATPALTPAPSVEPGIETSIEPSVESSVETSTQPSAEPASSSAPAQ